MKYYNPQIYTERCQVLVKNSGTKEKVEDL